MIDTANVNRLVSLNTVIKRTNDTGNEIQNEKHGRQSNGFNLLCCEILHECLMYHAMSIFFTIKIAKKSDIVTTLINVPIPFYYFCPDEVTNIQ